MKGTLMNQAEEASMPQAIKSPPKMGLASAAVLAIGVALVPVWTLFLVWKLVWAVV